MKSIHLRTLLIALLPAFLVACESSPAYHEYLMRAQVVKAQGREVVICAGSSDGAQPGQILNAYSTSENLTSDGLLVPERLYGGQVQVKTIINEHYATAVVISGKVNKYDLVELARQPMSGEH